MARKTLNFKSRKKLNKWLSYGHIHDVFKHHTSKSAPIVKLRGKIVPLHHGH